MLAANAADIGSIVRRRRTKAALSQGELAAKIGVSRKWIADLERGHPRAQLHLVLDVLNALDALVDIVDAPSAQQVAAKDSISTIAALTASSPNLDHIVKSMALPRETLRQIEAVQQQYEDALRSIRAASKAFEDVPPRIPLPPDPRDNQDGAS